MARVNRIELARTTLIGGVLFLVPLVIIVAVVGKAIGIMRVVAEPMADLLPVDSIGGVALANLIAFLCLLFVCYLAGLVARISFASEAMKSIEEKALMKIPGYVMIKAITSGMDASETQNMKPVLLTLGTVQRIGLEIEQLADGRSVVFIPSPPNRFSGITQIVPADQIEYLDVSVMDVMDYTEQYNRGTDALLEGRRSPAKTARR